MMDVEAAAATDIGPWRQINADTYLIDARAGLFAIADGMGDVPRSALVAQAALDAVDEMFQQPWSALPFEERSTGEAAERLWLGMVRANGRLYVPRGAGTQCTVTTFVGAVLCARHVCVAHAGDSRAYLLQAGTNRLVELTRDHTIQQEAIARGVPREVAEQFFNAYALTRAIGLRPSLDERPRLYPWEPGDALLLCSDGVSNALGAEEMALALLEYTDLERAAEGLVARAVMAGSRDNATVVIARRPGSSGAPNHVANDTGEGR